MVKRVSASDAKNNFGGLLDEVAAQGRVDVVKHGRLVAIVLSPQAFNSALLAATAGDPADAWGRKHMISSERARAARMLNRPSVFDEE